MEEVTFRFAERKDAPLIMEFILGLAKHEKAEDNVKVTEEQIEEWIFDKEKAEVLFVLAEEKEVGFALFFESFATYPGKGGIYLDDLFVRTEYRGRGYGKALFRRLAQITIERGGARMEWLCLDWNPSMEFYKAQGARTMDNCTTLRMEGNALISFAAGKK